MKLPSIAALMLVSVTAAACVTATQDKENMLSAAGFQMRLANTPEKVASLQKLPPHKFTVQSQNGQPVFLYADPTVCGCLYVGTQENFQNYQQMAFQQRMVNEQQMTAMMNQQAAFDYSPWGDGPWGPMMPID
ncbi:cytochrome c556 [Ancylobacter sp. 3268]|uniref:hypothetical protein n=1 Tax=Ancylobacter sp. 3268 TaxID=2817752 RepID=UPI0028638501|nr:hypothetical protein [Ancylobacter sp. 3268]MDR6951844.1 cytochrome c556 [Ancylobacter sp. 3268]